MGAPGDEEEQIPVGTPLDGRTDLHSIQYILAMVYDLKKLAAKSGHQRVALILEMAELEARDQIRKPEQ
jgi:hypothetical protein